MTLGGPAWQACPHENLDDHAYAPCHTRQHPLGLAEGHRSGPGGAAAAALAPERGGDLSAAPPPEPPTTHWQEGLPHAITSLDPVSALPPSPTAAPNLLAGAAGRAAHQRFRALSGTPTLYAMTALEKPAWGFNSAYPAQPIWGFTSITPVW